MAANLAVGNHADIAMPNMLIEQLSDDQSYVLVSLPWDGTSVDGEGNHVLIQLWLPANDSRVTITQVAPPNWPPIEGDLWIVPNVSPPAFVVSDGAGHMFFCTASGIRDAYTSDKKIMPPTTDQALAQYGNQLHLLYREPTQ